MLNKGNGAATFNMALDEALKMYDDDDTVYFLENDYLHKPGSLELLSKKHLN